MISIDELKSALRIRNDAEDDYIRTLADAAVAVIERDTGEYYGPTKSVTEVLTGSGNITWLLSTPTGTPVVEAYEGGEWNGITDFEISGRRIVFGETWRSPSEWRVAYDTGYGDDDVLPADVKLKIIQLVTLWYEQRLPTSDLLPLQHAVLGVVGSI